jgi:hypothetical protein
MSERRCSDCGAFHTERFSVCSWCMQGKYKARGAWCDDHGPTFGRCLVCTSPEPMPFGKERAEAIWAERRAMHAIEHAMTPGEISYVTTVLRTKPGDWCWMNVFYEILKGRITP